MKLCNSRPTAYIPKRNVLVTRCVEYGTWIADGCEREQTANQMSVPSVGNHVMLQSFTQGHLMQYAEALEPCRQRVAI